MIHTGYPRTHITRDIWPTLGYQNLPGWLSEPSWPSESVRTRRSWGTDLTIETENNKTTSVFVLTSTILANVNLLCGDTLYALNLTLIANYFHQTVRLIPTIPSGTGHSVELQGITHVYDCEGPDPGNEVDTFTSNVLERLSDIGPDTMTFVQSKLGYVDTSFSSYGIFPASG